MKWTNPFLKNHNLEILTQKALEDFIIRPPKAEHCIPMIQQCYSSRNAYQGVRKDV